MHMKAMADRLFGTDYRWSVLGAGRHQTNLVTMGAILGGNVRVGLEDSLFISRGVLAESNAQQVAKIVRNPLRALAGDRHARRGPRDPGAQGRRSDGDSVTRDEFCGPASSQGHE